MVSFTQIHTCVLEKLVDFLLQVKGICSIVTWSCILHFFHLLKSRLENVARKFPQIPLVCMCVHLQNLTLCSWIWLCCWLNGYSRTTEPLYVLNAIENPINIKYSRNDKILKTRENEKRCSMGKRLTNTFNSKKKTQFGKVEKLPILQRLSKSHKNWLLTHIRDILGETRLKTHLRTVPTIVIAHTFCASPDTRISYRQCLLIPGYFCAV